MLHNKSKILFNSKRIHLQIIFVNNALPVFPIHLKIKGWIQKFMNSRATSTFIALIIRFMIDPMITSRDFAAHQLANYFNFTLHHATIVLTFHIIITLISKSFHFLYQRYLIGSSFSSQGTKDIDEIFIFVSAFARQTVGPVDHCHFKTPNWDKY